MVICCKLAKKGLEVVKIDIADFISKRDGGVPANPDDIFLTTGASSGIKVIKNKIGVIRLFL